MGGTDDPTLVVHAGDGEALIVRAKDWRGGAAAVELLHAAIPPEAVFPTPAPMRIFDRMSVECPSTVVRIARGGVRRRA